MAYLTDEYESEIDYTATKYGIPENFLEASILQESSGDWANNNVTRCDIRPGDCMLPFVGVFQSVAESYGINFESLKGNRSAQIDAMGHIQKYWYDQPITSDWLDVAVVYFGGPGALEHGFKDEFGTTSDQYRANLAAKWKALDDAEGIDTMSDGESQDCAAFQADIQAQIQALIDAGRGNEVSDFLKTHDAKIKACAEILNEGRGWDDTLWHLATGDPNAPGMSDVVNVAGRVGVVILGVVLLGIGVWAVLR